jgi:Histidine kinase-, DNA gyrase B-, and HSP90-like ATPase
MALFYNPKAVESARDSGYKSTTHALAELIDNSFDAEADSVNIIFLEKTDDNNQRYVAEILVCDDGSGMEEAVLQICLQFGGGINTDLETIVSGKKRGKFGYGLPNASLSQCPRTHVYSWTTTGNFKKTLLDLELIQQADSIEIPKVEDTQPPAHFNQIGAVINEDHGTIVCWKDCDQLSHKRATTIINHAERHLGRLFRHLLTSGKKITLQVYSHNRNQGTYTRSLSHSVRCNDPLFLTEQCVLASILKDEADSHGNVKVRDALTPFVINSDRCKPTNVRLEEQCYSWQFKWQGKKYEFQFITSIASKDIQKPGIREGGNIKVGRFYGNKMDEGSITFVRAQREISSGSYGLYTGTDARHRWWTIEVTFTPEADKLLGVTNNKQDIGFKKTVHEANEDPFNEWESSLQEARTELWVQLSKHLQLIQREAFKQVKSVERDWDTQHTDPSDNGESGGPPSETPSTTAAHVSTDGTRPRRFSDDERLQLFQTLKNRFSSLDDEAIKSAVDRFDTHQVRGVLLYSPSDGDFLWSLTSVAGFLVILVNTNHEFYTNIMAPLRQANLEAALAGIELFLSSLAWDEYEHFWATETRRNVLEEYRSYVGLHLKRYLRENNIAINADELRSHRAIENEESDQ